MVITGRETLNLNPSVGGHPWDMVLEVPRANVPSPFSGSCMNDDGSVMFEEFTTLQLHHLLSNVEMAEYGDAYEVTEEYGDVQMDDHFCMYEFKVKKCARGRSHDWTDCPYTHPGEKARRRDPRKFQYSGNPCSEFRKGSCVKGDICEFAHGVFECWLHPSRYRTQPCKDGVQCRRKICFFAHTPEQLRILPPSHHVPTHTNRPESYDGTPSRLATDSHFATGSFGSSPTSTLYFPHCSTPTDSPPMSPVSSLGPNAFADLASSMRNLQIGKARRLSMSLMNGSPYSSPRIPYAVRPTPSSPGLKALEVWDDGGAREERMMERVESGKGVRAQIYAKLSRENALSESFGV
ncbi:hypothetical protein L2E82_06636 [Cichorium intybus]|uniref:Uncharacterized protein n=1 Tax=Cichorium intybus TaxID=13427 RepID=A0ACB9HBC3_CICIN|nr:hypothetical protein L2E82_06636 [Cichorium intybus]